MSFNFMSEIIVHSDFGVQEIKSVTASTFSLSICHEVMRLAAMILVYVMLIFKPAFSLSSFTFIKMLFTFLLFSTIRVVSSAYMGLLIIFLPEILTPACDSSSLAFHMMSSAYKQSDNIQPSYTPFPILNQFIVLCLLLDLHMGFAGDR